MAARCRDAEQCWWLGEQMSLIYDRASYADAAVPRIEAIVVSADRTYFHDLVEGLSLSRYAYVARYVEWKASAKSALEKALDAVRGLRPVIVFLDFEATGEQTEMLADWIFGLQRVMAVECVVTRPPADARRRVRLRRLGVTLFDGRDRTLSM